MLWLGLDVSKGDDGDIKWGCVISDDDMSTKRYPWRIMSRRLEINLPCLIYTNRKEITTPIQSQTVQYYQSARYGNGLTESGEFL